MEEGARGGKSHWDGALDKRKGERGTIGPAPKILL